MEAESEPFEWIKYEEWDYLKRWNEGRLTEEELKQIEDLKYGGK